MKATDVVAKRYLFSRKHISLIRTLTIISILGVTIGTSLLIIVLSVFNGFFEVIQQLLLANDPDVRIESAEGRSLLLSEDQFADIANVTHVVAISPYIQGMSLLAHQRSRDHVAVVKGIRPADYQLVSTAIADVREGSNDLGVRNQRPGVLISERMANREMLNIGDRIALLSTAGMQRSLTQFSGPRTFSFEVRGIYRQGRFSDEDAIYIDMEAARRLFSQRTGYSGVDIRLSDSRHASAIQRELIRKLGEAYTVSTWYDLKKSQYDVLNMEKWGAYFILMIIVLIAVLNIAGSLTMVVIQKKRDIGILMAMGMSASHIRLIFLKQGWYIGLIGCLLGGSAGLLLTWLQANFGLVKLAGSESFIIEAYPVAVSGSDVALVLAGSLILCLLASWYPSKRAAQTNPSEAVRYE